MRRGDTRLKMVHCAKGAFETEKQRECTGSGAGNLPSVGYVDEWICPP